MSIYSIQLSKCPFYLGVMNPQSHSRGKPGKFGRLVSTLHCSCSYSSNIDHLGTKVGFINLSKLLLGLFRNTSYSMQVQNVPKIVYLQLS